MHCIVRECPDTFGQKALNSWFPGDPQPIPDRFATLTETLRHPNGRFC
ncbi:hypothetical protein RISK_000341 [Rhodopirellula islandica]|uniref:Uncharacterized protein n=1 Tax=Rhodopirellula islandica TaxID=595434 RepID=A0A0J1EQA4_RHOIS|nr:hypothetical protein RISK_000341 [Rhodopirellula islandica]